MFSFGTGPVKGFAVTLSLGILTSMFTAIVISRAMVNFCLRWAARVRAVHLGASTVMEFFRKTRIDFMSSKWQAIIAVHA